MPVGKQTRKQKLDKGMTIPQLRRSFEHMQDFIRKTEYSLDKFRDEWKKVFHKDVSKSAAQDYLSYMKERSSATGTKQEGGMAPLDYQLRPGVEGTYGQFPSYVSGGFGFANHDSFRMGCGVEDISPRIPATMGSNLVIKGGGKKKRHMTKKRKQQKGGAAFPMPSLSSVMSEFMQRPILSSLPPGILQTAQNDWKGQMPLPTGDPSNNSLQYVKAVDTSIYTSSSSPASKVF